MSFWQEEQSAQVWTDGLSGAKLKLNLSPIDTSQLNRPFFLQLEHTCLLRPLAEERIVSPVHNGISWAYWLITYTHGGPSNSQFAMMTLKPLILDTDDSLFTKMIPEIHLTPWLRFNGYFYWVKKIFPPQNSRKTRK